MYARRRRGYFLMMGGCVVLFVSAWSFVRLWSIPAAVAMCAVAMVIPPVAAIIANRRGPDDRWWDEPAPRARPRPGAREKTTGGEEPGGRRKPGAGRPGPGRPHRPAGGPERTGPERTGHERPARGGTPGGGGGRTGDPTSDAWWDELDGRKRR
ncbi:DUF3099 domain-containing protein [uncultured Streptomyces sp.]|uniref:DUF3099 domain-containing protein n=1 Tax=uncultured Streptomyces sp. TaxID=174707 RepID=UPI002626EB4B|nr:DUF3099 domain-containing protein [uncultured Streptomyces sp.]